MLHFIDVGINDPDYDTIHYLIYHNTNYDIPGGKLQSLRLKLIDLARAKIAREASSAAPHG